MPDEVDEDPSATDRHNYLFSEEDLALADEVRDELAAEEAAEAARKADNVKYNVIHGLGTRIFLVSRSEVDGFLYNDRTGLVGHPDQLPGSATAHMGMTEFVRLRHVEDVPPRLIAIMAECGIEFTGEAIPQETDQEKVLATLKNPAYSR